MLRSAANEIYDAETYCERKLFSVVHVESCRGLFVQR